LNFEDLENITTHKVQNLNKELHYTLKWVTESAASASVLPAPEKSPAGYIIALPCCPRNMTKLFVTPSPM
jgi:hypothetical protein